MAVYQLIKIDIGKNVHVVEQDMVAVLEERLCKLESAGGVEQQVGLVGDADVGIEGVDGDELLHQVAEMVYVDHNVVDACGGDTADDRFEQSFAVHLHKGLGAVFGKRIEAGAEARGEDHCGGFHKRGISLSRIVPNFQQI